MKKSTLIFGVAALVLLGSCSNPTRTSSAPAASSNGASSNQPTTSSAAPTSSTTPISSPSEQETYMVVITANSGVNVTASKTTAQEGDVITLTYTVNAGYTLVSITMNGTALTLNDGTATFTMPNRDVTIKCSVNISGDVVLNGDIAVSLSKQEDGTYAAKDVTVANDSTFCVEVTKDGTPTVLDGSEIVDNRKTFANIENSSKDNYLVIKGGAVYNFYYDPTNDTMPFSVQRVGTNVMPTDTNSLSDLLYMKGIKSDPTSYPAGVTAVNFFDSRTSETYAWKKYNQASLATVTAAGDTTPSAYVYKSMDNDVYTVVDNYREGRSWTSPLPYSTASKEALDASSIIGYGRNEDTTSFSGKYKLVDAIDGYTPWSVNSTTNWGSYKYEYLKKSGAADRDTYTHDANFDVYAYSHDVNSIQDALWESYFNGFAVEDDRTAASVSITSSRNADEGFTTTIDSYQTYTPSTVSSSSTSGTVMKSDVHVTYKANLTFTKAGAPLSGTFIEKMYDSNDFNFSTGDFKTGGEANGTIVKKFNYTYTYGTAETGKPTFDTTPYFAKSVAASITGTNTGVANTINAGEDINDTSNDYVTNPLVIKTSPTTALDGWEYALTSSSDTTKVYYDQDHRRWSSSTNATGNVTLTVANGFDSTLSTTISLTINGGVKPYSFSVISSSGNSDNIISSSSVFLYAGDIFPCYLSAWPSKSMLTGISFSYSTAGLISCSFDPTTAALTIDSTGAKAITAETKVTVTINDTNYDPESKGPTTFTVTLEPNASIFTTVDSIFGTWNPEASVASTYPGCVLTMSNTLDHETSSVHGLPEKSRYYKGSVVVDDTTFSFLYLYDQHMKTMSYTGVKAEGGKWSKYTNFEMAFYCEMATNKVGVALEAYAYETSGSYTRTYYSILGGIAQDSSSDDDSGYDDASAISPLNRTRLEASSTSSTQYVFFDKA